MPYFCVGQSVETDIFSMGATDTIAEPHLKHVYKTRITTGDAACVVLGVIISILSNNIIYINKYMHSCRYLLTTARCGDYNSPSLTTYSV